MKYVYLLGILVLGVALFGCIASPPEVPPPPPPPPPTPPCEDAECLFKLANDCKTETVTLTESFGTVEYSLKSCVLTKKVVSRSSLLDII